MPVGLPLKTTYANGDVYSASDVNDTNGTINANATPYAAGKNKVINGAFDNWQRGTSFTLTTGTLTYCADRFIFTGFGSGTAATVTRQTFTPGTAPVAGYEGQYFARFTNFSTATAWQVRQRIENVQTFAGQTITFSFWAKASGSLSNIVYEMTQNFGSGGSSAVTTTLGSGQTLSTSWTRYSFTVAVPSISGKTIGTSSYLEFSPYQNSGVTNSGSVDFWGWQVENGSTATPFQTATGTIQGELAACQRYYLLVASGVGGPIAAAWYPTSTAMSTIVNFPVELRTVPTVVQTTGTGYYNIYAVAGNDGFNSLTIDIRSSRACLLYNNTEAGGTAGSTGNCATNNASASLALNAEL
jgi:hypothetical protein